MRFVSLHAVLFVAPPQAEPDGTTAPLMGQDGRKLTFLSSAFVFHDLFYGKSKYGIVPLALHIVLAQQASK